MNKVLVAIELMRPKQWIKNLLVFSVPILSGQIVNQKVLINSSLLFLTFSFTSSAIYIFNDLLDINNDKFHPKKFNRPLASERISIRESLFIFLSLTILSLTFGFYYFNFSTFGILISYFFIQILYCLKIKNISVVELGSVASGFVLRSMSGGASNDIQISFWFMAVVSSVAFLIVSGKRYSEYLNLGQMTQTRNSLKEYSLNFLQTIINVSLTLSIIFYSLWSFENSSTSDSPLHYLSTGVFALLFFKYTQLIETGEAESPEDVIFSNNAIWILVVLWVLLTFASLSGVI